MICGLFRIAVKGDSAQRARAGKQKNGEWKSYDYIPFEMLQKQWQTVVLKLIRKKLTKQEMKKVQPRLQKAYSENGEGFYVYAPKQKGNVKQQLGYIGRYIRRPAIAVSRIEEYDGETVTFRYLDKMDGEQKRETIRVEEFIGRLIRHIPDENFKTIRYYGVYLRRIKSLCKKLVSEWQKEARRWIEYVTGVQETKSSQEKEKAIAAPKQLYEKQRNSEVHMYEMWRRGRNTA